MKVKGQERRVESQTGSVGLRSLSDPRPSTFDPRLSRSGVTLVELLITMLIISILAALVLGVAAVAGQTAKEAHTRHMVARLHTLVMEQYDTYKNRRVRLNPYVETQINNQLANSPSARGKALAEARLYALREMILMDMPDRWSDVNLAPVGDSTLAPLYTAQRTELSNNYLRRYLALLNRVNSISGTANTFEEIQANQSAECLYMMVMLATGDGEARSLFGENDIGDTDGDGAPELLDGWGHPIGFLRWAPGFNSQIQLNLNELANSMTVDQANQAVAADHDPYDLFRADLRAFRLVPLIFSLGRDDNSGIVTNDGDVTWRLNPSNVVTVRTSPDSNVRYLFPPLDPYGATSNILGTTIDEAATDNVHNHLLGQR